jgi:chromosome segregation ATPase
MGCLGAVIVCGVGLLWAFDWLATDRIDLAALRGRVLMVFGLTALVGVGLALWLDRAIVVRLRHLLHRFTSGSIPDLHHATAPNSWGELGDLEEAIHRSLARQRQLARAADELEVTQRQLRMAREAVERWVVSERWGAMPTEEGPLAAVTEALNRGFGRHAEIQEQNQQAARQVRIDLASSLEVAHESAEQAEHGFVEATSLLTTLRELQRLRGELQQMIAGAAQAPGSASSAYAQWRETAAAAIEELIEAAGESVDHLAQGLLRVQEIADQVQVLSNRATLIALNTVVAGARPEGAGNVIEGLASELKQLAREVRGATERVSELSRAIEQDVRAATERMHGVRERVAQRLEQPAEAGAPSVATEEIQHLLERVREMVQDATRKGERFSSSGERASRAAQALVLRLEDVTRDLDGLAVRLAPVGSAADESALPSVGREPRAEDRTRLRVVDRRDEPRSGDPGRGRGERT